MNTKSLVTFKTILEMGSFQKAADKLGYTQSTVTFQVKQLEEELDLKLFEKIGRRMELTQTGKDIMPYIDMILQGTEQINNYGKSLSEITGSLKLAIPDSILIYNMQPFIQAFSHEAPNVQLVINSMQSGEINQAVKDGAADIGINCEKDSYPDAIVHKRLGKYKAILVASPFADSSLLDFITPHQRKPFSLICNEPDGYYQLEMDKYLAQKDIVLNPYMKVFRLSHSSSFFWCSSVRSSLFCNCSSKSANCRCFFQKSPILPSLSSKGSPIRRFTNSSVI